jgi:hypothetical protein
MKTSSKHKMLREIVNEVFGVDIMDKSRKRNIVDARMVYAKILRDAGYSLTDIGGSIGKHHTTIISYLSEGEYMIPNIRQLHSNYHLCKDIFDGKTAGFDVSMPYSVLVDKIALAEKNLSELKEYKRWYEEKYGKQ